MNIPDWPYQTKTAALVPYDKKFPVFGDGLMALLYMRLMESGHKETIFGETSFDEFVNYMTKRGLAAQIYCFKDGDKLDPAGFCWVDEMVGKDGERRALFGFTFFKYPRSRMRDVADLGLLGLAYWFRELKITMLYGVTMDANRAAQAFSRRYGFAQIAGLPHFLYRGGTLVSAIVVMLTWEDLEPRYREWLRGQAELEFSGRN